GQVAGAFYREDLGYIDLVWGSVEGKGKEARGLGLSKIVEKHIEDFKGFAGNTPLEKLANGLDEIINKGEFKAQENTSATIKYTKDGNLFRVGLRQNWMGEPTKNKWVITAYKDEREALKIIDSKGFTEGETLPSNPKANSTTPPLKGQDKEVQELATQWEIITGSKDMATPFSPQIPKDIQEALKPVFKKGIQLTPTPPTNELSKWYIFVKNEELPYVKETFANPDLVFDTGNSIRFFKRIEAWQGQDMDFLEVAVGRDKKYFAVEKNNALGLELAKQDYITLSKDQKALTAKEVRAWEKAKEEAQAKEIAAL
ncbi:DUF3519 domain-containing protein, partial [Helicobacter baculiformis]